ncbi:hypothetical protein RN001_002893 [Aquatica leii]|uniref:Uncharacterized protein n=1 Tax=Aquatica leii TaxID=1421715 RepID=A0AAN7SKF0_9COLE|nr:hypothetical protein RN001_002893 [Aquatica leii]
MLIIIIIIPSYVNPDLIKGSSQKTALLKNMYLSIVSLNIPSYVDDNLDRRFICTGVIVTSKWILVGDDCFLYTNDWLNLQVRAGSELWSSGGTQHNIVKMVRLFTEGPAVFNVDPPFIFNEFIKPIKLIEDKNLFEWTYAYCIYWLNPNKDKDRNFLTEVWSKILCYGSSKLGIMKEFLSISLKPFSSPLLTSEGVLVGYKLGVNDYRNGAKLYVFLDLQNGEYKYWLERLITTGEPLHSVDDFEDNLNFNSTILLYGSNHECTPVRSLSTAETSRKKDLEIIRS